MVALTDGTVGTVHRLDLPRPGDGVPTQALGLVQAALAVEPCSEVILLVFDDGDAAYWPALDQLEDVCADLALPVLDRLHVSGGRWRSLDCRGLGCCPADGYAIPADDEVPQVAEWVGLGVCPLPDRDGVDRLFDPPADGVRIRVRRSARPPGAEGADGAGWAAWARILGTGEPWECLPPSVAGRALALVADVGARDAFIAWWCPRFTLAGADVGLIGDLWAVLGPSPAGEDAGLSPADAAHRVWRLRDFARRLPEREQPGVLAIVAAQAWWHGEGAIARAAADRALSIDPDHRLAGLLQRVIAWGVRPMREFA